MAINRTTEAGFVKAVPTHFLLSRKFSSPTKLFPASGSHKRHVGLFSSTPVHNCTKTDRNRTVHFGETNQELRNKLTNKPIQFMA